MTRSLRRSRRGGSKKVASYRIGDVVEIVRGAVTMKGRLAFKLTEGTSPNPRWLLKFDGQTFKDEEVYERSFGKLLHSVEDDDALTPPLPPASSARRAPPPTTTSTKPSSGTGRSKVAVANSGKDSNKSVNGTSSEENEADKSSPEQKTNKNGNGRKSVSFSGGSPAPSDDSSAQDAVETNTGGRRRGGKVSAREARSLRRQAKIDDREVVSAVMAVTHATSGGGLIGLNHHHKHTSHKRRLPPKSGGHHKAKRPRTEGDDEVVKVKLLTGTLYLYRGLHRRAEFIRRV